MSDVHGAEDSSSEDASTEKLVPQEMVSVPETAAAVENANDKVKDIKDKFKKWQEGRRQGKAAYERAIQEIEAWDRAADAEEAWREIQAVANRAVVEELDRAAGYEVEDRTNDEIARELRHPTRQRERGIAHGIAEGRLPFQMPVIIRVPPRIGSHRGPGGVGASGVRAAANTAERWLRDDTGIIVGPDPIKSGLPPRPPIPPPRKF